MNHEEFNDQYELFVLGVADPEVAEEIRWKLAAGDSKTVLAVEKARELAAALSLTAPLVEPPSRLRRRILAAVEPEPDGYPKWIWAWISATALLGLVTFNFWQREQVKAKELAEVREELIQSTTRLATVSQLLEFLNEPQLKVATFGKPEPQPPRGRALISPQKGVLLLVSNLQPAAQGRIYEMWVIPKKGAPVPAGLFQSGTDGRALHVNGQPVDLAQVAAIAVTDEPQAGSAAPTTTPFIVAPIGD